METVDHLNYCLVAALSRAVTCEKVTALWLSLNGTHGRRGLNSSLEESVW